MLWTEILGCRVLPRCISFERRLVSVASQVEFKVELSFIVSINEVNELICGAARMLEVNRTLHKVALSRLSPFQNFF